MEKKTATEKEKSEHSFVADQQNWEQRVRTELESGRVWNENWGTLFSGNIPSDYTERVKYLENELKSVKKVDRQVKYGVGKPFNEVGQKDFRRKKMFMDAFSEYDA